MGLLLQDFRYAFRMLRKNPGFTSIAVISLALAIGAITSVFSLYNSLILKSLPIKDPQQLRMINWIGSLSPPIFSGRCTSTPDGQQISNTFTYPTYCKLRDDSTNLGNVFAFLEHHPTILYHDQSFTADGFMVSGNFFSGLGIEAMLGGTITPQHDKASAGPVAVISYSAWQRHFNKNPDIIGETIVINNNSFTIIGVMPQNFAGLETGRRIDFYTPIAFQPAVEGLCAIESNDRWWVQVMARIQPGISESELQNSLQTLLAQVEPGASSGEMRILLTDGSGGLSGPLVPTKTKMVNSLFILMPLAGIVLLAACVNIASLLLARGAARQQEVAVRAAIGAGRLHLIRQGLTESLLIALAGTVGGLLFAMWVKQFLYKMLWPSQIVVDLSLDVTVFEFTIFICVGSALLFGLLPAWRYSRVNPIVSLKEHSSRALSHMRLGRCMVSIQTALALLLLAGAALFIRTLINLYQVETGFNTKNILVFSLDSSKSDMENQQKANFHEQVRSSIAALPGVLDVANSNLQLLDRGRNETTIDLPNRSDRHHILLLDISNSFLSTMGIPLLAGRDFDAADHPGSDKVMIINRKLAQSAFVGESPIGKILHIRGSDYRIVGVCGDTKYYDLKMPMESTVFFPCRQHAGGGHLTYQVHTASEPLFLVPAIRKILADSNANVPMSDIKTMTTQLNESIANERCFAVLAMSLALLAVLLSCIGLFGLMSYYTTQRTGEIGIRMALGAQSFDIGFSVLRSAISLVLIGTLIGIPLVLVASRFIKSYIFGIEPYDPLSIAGAIVLLIFVSLAAVWLPARRAAKVDPMEALRYE
ncbi:MAG: ABC transporter permease [Sedimentisphaerales bacterium]|nr:ABC transporter permease [Sedimentisphaerales bacterium]